MLSSNWSKLQPLLPKRNTSTKPGKRKRNASTENVEEVENVEKRNGKSTIPKVKKGKKLKAGKTEKSLESMIQLELGRWEIMDNLVQSYDEHISPVLGGNDTLRNEQKRKRHLEAWLWSRLFFPLLPLGEPTTTAISAGDDALMRKLCNAGLSKKDAKRRIQRLATVLSSEIQPSTDNVVVQVEEEKRLIRLKCGKRQVQLLPEYFTKLKELTSKNLNFHQAAFLVLARYRILQVHEKGGGNQGAIPPAVFQSLKDWWSEPIEAFASPLNTLAGKGFYHSAFNDIDGIFGSRGSFFDSTFQEGFVEVNPPFDEDLVHRAAQKCHSSLEEAEHGQRALAFVIIIPETDWAGHSAFLESRFKKWSLTLPSGSHFYQVGNQHVNPQRSYPASRNTTVLLLASPLIQKTKVLRQRMDEAFRRRP